MSKKLVIVESPGKISKIGQYLGNDYIVKASFGHVQDLDKSTLSIEVENNFNPLYKISPDKTKVVKELKALAKDCSDVILAADGDREGEAIAYSLANVLHLKNPKRIVFNEITKDALMKAVNNPSTINYDMVHAQQARRLLDRLIGYEISPVLLNNITDIDKDKSVSAGRVQSVVLRIIIDKENDIETSISQPYLKTTCEFQLKDSNDIINSVLSLNNKLFQFESKEIGINFMKQINKNTIFKVITVDNKKSIRKASAPFITSSLQQDASTKLHFSVKKTMQVAQKLYEAGLITYMRTDSPNISKQAIDETKKYIIKTFGLEYSEPKNYESKNSTSQDAHECIRPTHINDTEPENIDADMIKLYSLIWKRTVASQMTNAQVNIQTITIDTQNNKKTILIFNKNQTYFISTLENIEFQGYLIVYDNTNPEDEKIIGKLSIKPNDLLSFNKLNIIEEFTKPPLRYNEASLVKHLEKNGIGRPSTYASIISKVIERNYVEIKNIDGQKKQSTHINMNKDYDIKESIKEVFIGKEQKKLVPTDFGIKINDFMLKHFDAIMDVEFTANFETYLDKISEGKANWITILKNYYDLFHPIVEKLNDKTKEIKKTLGNQTDKLIGTNENGQEIYYGIGKFGPYVKIHEDDEDSKWKYASVKDKKFDDITIDYANELLKYPRILGKIDKGIVKLNKGPYGLYLIFKGSNISIKDTEIEPDSIDIEYAKTLINAGDPYALKTFKVKDKVINIKNGDYGPYIQINNGTKKQFISIPSSYSIDKINIDDVLKIIADKNGSVKQQTKKYIK